jgi:hypothetical protein
MYNTSKLIMVLFNIYFNLGLMISPMQEYNFHKSNNVFDREVEIKMDNLLKEYANKLVEIHKIEDDIQAKEAMQKARYILWQKGKLISIELEALLGNMSACEAQLFKIKQLQKPFFKQINDARMAYILSGRLEKNAELKKAFHSMDDFISLLYS